MSFSFRSRRSLKPCTWKTLDFRKESIGSILNSSNSSNTFSNNSSISDLRFSSSSCNNNNSINNNSSNSVGPNMLSRR